MFHKLKSKILLLEKTNNSRRNDLRRQFNLLAGGNKFFQSILSANCSFVSSYPNFENDGANDHGIFKFHASDNIGIIGLLNKNNQLDTIKNNKDAQQNYNIILNLFKNTIDNILSHTDDHALVAMQEINNTKDVYTIVTDKLKDKNRFFMSSNVYDKESNTYPSMGFILPGKEDNYVHLKTNLCGKIYVNTTEEMKYKDLDTENEKRSSYSLAKNLNSLIAIRDLGKSKDLLLSSYGKDKKFYVLKKVENNRPVTDSGRPISMVVRGSKEIPTDVFINCHMINASILKVFTQSNGTFKEEYDGKTLLQMSDEKNILGSGKTGNELWFEYCIRRMEETINDMLINDFGITSFETYMPNMFIMGDFNDPEGTLFEYFKNHSIKVLNKKFFIQFGNALKTCCPNTNSSKEKEGETAQTVKYKAPMNKSLRDFIESDTMREKALKVFEQEPLFKGDNIGQFYVEETSTPTVHVTKLSHRTSDHHFVKMDLN